jgi:hypothetical protein
MFIVCINAQGQRYFYYIRQKSGSCLFSHCSTMTVVTNKIIGSKAIILFQNNTYYIFKIVTLTLEMYCGLHVQFRRAHYRS